MGNEENAGREQATEGAALSNDNRKIKAGIINQISLTQDKRL
jgi:hypothetical protein